MRALVYDAFGGPLEVRDLPDPQPPSNGVVVRVGATGVCRSDWHGWQGHDPDITAFPHVPGHELAGTVAAVGAGVQRWAVGDRVTVPFVTACGTCAQCREGDQQVCSRQRQPGFTHWGAMAELVAIDAADVNLVALPAGLPFVAAAALGCRFATAYRAVVQVGAVRPGEAVVVHGCGGVGLSAIQVALASGARVVGVDPSAGARAAAEALGATAAAPQDDLHALTGGGAHLSLDAFGSADACLASIACLRPRGRHVQVGLLPGPPPPIPMARLLAEELAVLGSHGMPAHGYPALLDLITSGSLDPAALVTRRVGLDRAGEALLTVGQHPGITVVEFPA